MALSHTSRLQAVNLILSNIGSNPVSSLEVPTNSDSVLAEQVLDEVSREVQMEGWTFNSDEDVEYTPDGSGFITLPSNVVSADPKLSNSSANLVLRGRRLYDATEHSYVFTDSVTLDTISLLEWDELPEAARYYIAIRAARKFAERVQGDANTRAFNAQDEAMARTKLESHDLRQGDFNIFSSYAVGAILDRRSPLDTLTT